MFKCVCSYFEVHFVKIVCHCKQNNLANGILQEFQHIIDSAIRPCLPERAYDAVFAVQLVKTGTIQIVIPMLAWDVFVITCDTEQGQKLHLRCRSWLKLVQWIVACIVDNINSLLTLLRDLRQRLSSGIRYQNTMWHWHAWYSYRWSQRRHVHVKHIIITRDSLKAKAAALIQRSAEIGTLKDRGRWHGPNEEPPSHATLPLLSFIEVGNLDHTKEAFHMVCDTSSYHS